MIALWILFAVVFAMAAAILILPLLVKRAINRKLSNLDGYTGSIRSARIKLGKCSLVAHGVTIDKVTRNGIPIPFFTARGIGVKLNFRKLLKKHVEGVVVVEHGTFEMSKAPDSKAEKDPAAIPFNLRNSLAGMSPFCVDIFFKEAELRYVDHSGNEPVEVNVNHVDVQLLTLSNLASVSDCDIKITARLYDGSLALNMKLQPMALKTTFDMNADIRNINLALLNPYLRNHVRLDVNTGTFNLFTEVACFDGKFEGYIKPMITDLDVIGPQDKGDSILRRAWEALVAFTYQILKNKAHDQVASKIRIKGELDNPHINVVSAVLSILKNGFIRGLTPSVEDVISPDKIKKAVYRSKEWVGRILS